MLYHAFTLTPACPKFSHWNVQLVCFHCNNFMTCWISLVLFLMDVCGNKSVTVIKFSSLRSSDCSSWCMATLFFSSFFFANIFHYFWKHQICQQPAHYLCVLLQFKIHIVASSLSFLYVAHWGYPMFSTFSCGSAMFAITVLMWVMQYWCANLKKFRNLHLLPWPHLII